MVRIPMTDEDGDEIQLVARVCRPDGDAPAPVAVIVHGDPPEGDSLADMSPAACASPPAAWFRARGYVVVLPLRRGYGESEGGFAENPGACASPDDFRAGLAAARDLDAVLSFAVHQPFAKAEGAVLLGEDSGGWGVIAYASQKHEVAASLIQLGGVLGARSAGRLGHVCRPDLLIEAAARFGSTARTPMLWIYAANDKVVPSDVVAALHDAFLHAGGQAELVQPQAPGADGHALLFDEQEPEIWGGVLAFYLGIK
jgi:pimeloyl-ACP methyl ester carboxylesterase